ncbi:hypothetical protein EI372_07900 [Vibrio fluvialis]|nr:hypothetical protein [Vibrio fluvialis]
MKTYSVLKNEDSISIESNQEQIEKFVSSGYEVVAEINAMSPSDAQLKYEELLRRKREPGKESNPAGYLNVVSTVFIAISLIACLALFIAGSNMKDGYYEQNAWMAKYFYISGAAWFIISLLIHSACRCLIYITKKQASKTESNRDN